ncbi:phosphoadenosine phosphosulfate reductase family protein [Methanoculleus sp.]|uniref:phosphoadenosine phosphosulfate reductase family protein n=1 Tax=Methanoculleus sp. TaxID=90427 RepID=UPI00260DCC49|nr:phosphoadenosine phosphosulfate reductase family protein [Methanoculleus sp.]MDD2255471.1 phosphoadenosine phosphosulfate reductase family protein [Methanoculleus sp.]
MLRETTLEGVIDKELVAIERIKQYEPEEGYYVAFSGGKDSIVVYDLVKRAGVKHDVHFNATTVDPPEVVKFIKTYYPEVDWIRPKKSMFQIIVKHMMLPTGNMRFCCHELKEIGGKGRTVVLGVRREESMRRRNRLVYDESKRQKGKMFLNPIVDWSEDEVWEYIHKYNLPYPCLYDEGYKRVGCIMCPLQNIKGRERDKERYPKYYNAYLLAIKRMLKKEKKLVNRLKMVIRQKK